MRLEHARDLGSSVGCWICQNAGKLLEVWPIEPGEYIRIPQAQVALGRNWRIRVKNLGEVGWAARWTGKREAHICTRHAIELYEEWQYTALLEVKQAKAFDDYIEREEHGQDY